MTLIKPSPNSNTTYLLGHRGARGEQLENSKASFIYTQRLSHQSQGRLVGIEFDVQLTKDGKLVVFHDDCLQRLFGKQSRVDQCTSKEIQRISQLPIARLSDKPYLQGTTKPLSNPIISTDSDKAAVLGDRASKYIAHPVLLLEDMPDLLQDYRHIELEIKTHQRTDYPKLIEALRFSLAKPSFNNLPITLTSFDVHLLYLLQNDAFLNRFKRGLLVEPKSQQTVIELATTRLDNKSHAINNYRLMSTGEPLSHTVNIALRLQCQSIGLYYPLFDLSFISECAKYGLSTTAWTVNNLDDANYLSQIGVNYLITDYPCYFLMDFE